MDTCLFFIAEKCLVISVSHRMYSASIKEKRLLWLGRYFRALCEKTCSCC